MQLEQNPKLKICGLKSGENLRQILTLNPDFVGFIFYEKSPRFVGLDFDLNDFSFKKTQKVGVFVDAALDFVFEKIEKHGLEVAQLHGSESPDFCQKVGEKARVWKAFGIEQNFDFELLKNYETAVEAFLFDTKTTTHGGSGAAFDWSILKKMDFEKKWILSGGLSVENLQTFFETDLPRPFLIDVNLRFEDAPGFKNVEKCRVLIEKITKPTSPKTENAPENRS